MYLPLFIYFLDLIFDQKQNYHFAQQHNFERQNKKNHSPTNPAKRKTIYRRS